MIKDLEIINVLLVEDNLPDAFLLKRNVKKLTTIEVNVTHVESCQEAVLCLKQINFDVILLDLSLPDSHNLETVRYIYKNASDIPIVVLTGLNDEEIAIASLREGAQDYLVKGEINSNMIIRAIRYAIERKQKLAEIKILNQKLSNSNQELENYAYLVSHDLKQPLQTIISSINLVLYKEENLKETSIKLLNLILDASFDMNELIEDLLSYSRIDKNKENSVMVDCRKIVDKVLSNLDSQIQESNAIINIDFDDYESLMVLYNPTNLSQLFQNLISNAMRYVSKNQSPIININVEKQKDNWLFSIQDNGIGIKEENQQRIFNMFERIESCAKEYSGTGIGLAMCQKIVENHGGDIWVKSEISVGSTFYFTIPVPIV